jgi:hypothetical protein
MEACLREEHCASITGTTISSGKTYWRIHGPTAILELQNVMVYKRTKESAASCTLAPPTITTTATLEIDANASTAPHPNTLTIDDSPFPPSRPSSPPPPPSPPSPPSPSPTAKHASWVQWLLDSFWPHDDDAFHARAQWIHDPRGPDDRL